MASSVEPQLEGIPVPALAMLPHESAKVLMTQPEPDGFLLDLVHDLRQPLSTIDSVAYLLAQRLPQDMQELHPLLMEIQQQVAHANRRLCQALESCR